MSWECGNFEWALQIPRHQEHSRALVYRNNFSTVLGLFIDLFSSFLEPANHWNTTVQNIKHLQIFSVLKQTLYLFKKKQRKGFEKGTNTLVWLQWELSMQPLDLLTSLSPHSKSRALWLPFLCLVELEQEVQSFQHFSGQTGNPVNNILINPFKVGLNNTEQNTTLTLSLLFFDKVTHVH